MSDDKTPKPFNLTMHTARLLMNEPFFAALSRRIEKTRSTALPTAGVRVNPSSAQFELMYNPEFMGALSDKHQLGVLKHEFYHIIFEHVTGRKPPGGLKRLDNIAMDLAINSHIANELPNESEPGPVIGKGEPMKACIPGEGPFAKYPLYQTYEWYKARLEQDQEENDEGGEGEGGEGGEGGDPFDGADSFDSHDDFGDAQGTAGDIAKECLRDAVKKAAEEAEKARNWGTMTSDMRKQILDSITTKIDWRKVLRYFVRTSQRADKRSTPRRLNKRFPKIHPGKRVRRQARLAVSIDQSGSVSDGMLALFFAELNKLSDIAEFTVIPFDTEVDEKLMFVWKKGQSRTWERVKCGGTDFNPPTKYVNQKGFDGHIILTDLCAPKPVASKCQRMWMTTPQYAARPYFQTNERVVAME